jgi:hypothetical protein
MGQANMVTESKALTTPNGEMMVKMPVMSLEMLRWISSYNMVRIKIKAEDSGFSSVTNHSSTVKN